MFCDGSLETAQFTPSIDRVTTHHRASVDSDWRGDRWHWLRQPAADLKYWIDFLLLEFFCRFLSPGIHFLLSYCQPKAQRADFSTNEWQTLLVTPASSVELPVPMSSPRSRIHWGQPAPHLILRALSIFAQNWWWFQIFLSAYLGSACPLTLPIAPNSSQWFCYLSYTSHCNSLLNAPVLRPPTKKDPDFICFIFSQLNPFYEGPLNLHAFQYLKTINKFNRKCSHSFLTEKLLVGSQTSSWPQQNFWLRKHPKLFQLWLQQKSPNICISLSGVLCNRKCRLLKKKKTYPESLLDYTTVSILAHRLAFHLV